MTSLTEVGRILEAATHAGMPYLDTAYLYGESEQVLGLFAASLKKFRVITKTPYLGHAASAEESASALAGTFRASLDRLNLASCYGLMVHRADDLLSPAGAQIFDALRTLKEAGLVSMIGVSVYTAQQIDAVTTRFPMDLVQAPVSVFDQRLVRSGHLQRLRDAGVEVHARSVFLQGALLMDPADLPAPFASVQPQVEAYRSYISRRGLSPLAAALGFAMGLECIDSVICGVNTLVQLKEILATAEPLPSRDFAGFALTREDILDPATWSRT